MRPHRTQLPIVFRLFAVAWLLVWLTAQTLCVQHCALRTFAKAGGHECCTKKASDSSKTPASAPSIACGGLKVAKLDSKTSLSERSPLILLTVMPVFVLRFPEVSADSVFADYVRALPRADFVFRPEVSLGAALRCHAPPALA